MARTGSITGLKIQSNMNGRSNEAKGGYSLLPCTKEAKKHMEKIDREKGKMTLGESKPSSKSTARLWLDEVGRLSLLEMFSVSTLSFSLALALSSRVQESTVSVATYSVLVGIALVILSLAFVLSLKLLREKEEMEHIINLANRQIVILQLENEKLASCKSTTPKTKSTGTSSCDKGTTLSIIETGDRIEVDKGICGKDCGIFVQQDGISNFGSWGRYLSDKDNKVHIYDTAVHRIKTL